MDHDRADNAADTLRLKADVIGPWGLAALVIGVTSPAIGLFATWGPIEATAGPVVPLVFLAALAIVLPTVLSYASLNRHAPSAGAIAVWLRMAINPTTGLIAGLAMATYFLMTAITVPLLFSLFFRDLLDWLHVGIPAMAALAIGLVLHSIVIAAICVRGAEVSIKTTIRLMLIEMTVVLALSATILWVKAGQPGGITLGPFNPAHASQGLAGFWAAIILGILAFSGFDVVATAAEEAQAPRENVPRVLILAVLGIGIFWALNAWVLTLSTPPNAVAQYTAQGLTAITPVARAYWGWGDIIVIATAFTGLTAIYIGCVQGASRIIFALARQRLLLGLFANLEGEKRVPRNAVLFVVLVCVFAGLSSLAVLRNGLDSFVWWSNAMVFFAALTFTGVNVANLLYFRRILPQHFTVARNLLVPVIGVLVNLYLIYAAFFSSLWWAPFRMGGSIVIACLVLFVLELAAAAWMRLFRRDLLQQAA
ncbi:MAG TPA: APC family permease [Rhizomicrobium sp.]|jgi:amino acid transporter